MTSSDVEQAEMLDYIRECSANAHVSRARQKRAFAALAGASVVVAVLSAAVAVAGRSGLGIGAVVMAAAAAVAAIAGAVSMAPAVAAAEEVGDLPARYEAACAQFLDGVRQSEKSARFVRWGAWALAAAVVLALVAGFGALPAAAATPSAARSPATVRRDETGGTWRVQRTVDSALLVSGPERIELTSVCTAQSKGLGDGFWYRTDQGFAVVFGKREIAFPGQQIEAGQGGGCFRVAPAAR